MKWLAAARRYGSYAISRCCVNPGDYGLVRSFSVDPVRPSLTLGCNYKFDFYRSQNNARRWRIAFVISLNFQSGAGLDSGVSNRLGFLLGGGFACRANR